MARAYGVWIAAALCGAMACRTPGSPDENRVPAGTWGGDHIRIDVSRSGATLEYDCAHGTIDGPLIADANGQFSVVGFHTFERGGPIRQDETASRHPARYDGRVEGDQLRITVTLADTRQSLGSFTATWGVTARLFKCL